MTTTPPLLRSLLPAVGILLSALGILGLARGEREGWGGFIYSPQRVVEWVEPGSAAADAGLQPGDSILTVDGRPRPTSRCSPGGHPPAPARRIASSSCARDGRSLPW